MYRYHKPVKLKVFTRVEQFISNEIRYLTPNLEWRWGQGLRKLKIQLAQISGRSWELQMPKGISIPLPLALCSNKELMAAEEY